MTLLFVDGFDDRGPAGTFPSEKGWNPWGIAPGLDANDGRFGTQAMHLNINGRGMLHDVPAAHTDPTIIVGLLVKPLVLFGAVNVALIQLFGDGGLTSHISILHKSDDTLEVKRGGPAGTLLGTSTALNWQVGVAQYLEIKVLIHDSAGTVDIHQGEISILSLTAQDTKEGGTNDWIDTVGVKAGVTTWFMDDYYEANTIGTDLTDFAGEGHVETSLPDTEGALIQYTPSAGADNSDTIDENPPNDTDYNSNGTAAQIDRFNMGHLADAGVTIHGIQLGSWAQKSAAGARSFRHNLLSTASVATGGDHSLGSGFGWYLDVFENDPDGGAAWTGAKLDAAEMGYETRT